MKLEKSVERQTKNTIEYYKNLDNLEDVPVDILRIIYKDLLQNSIPKKKIKDKIQWLDEMLNYPDKEIIYGNYRCTRNILEELLKDK